ncbi:MAG: UDP-N-acetylmuramate--L-alanine ligase [Arenicella sp.]
MRNVIKKIHFVGVGGSGMSGIAEVLSNLDFEVSGSDIQENKVVDRLRLAGITVHIGHHQQNIANADVVVVSSAIDEQNPEVCAAMSNDVPVIPRAEMLGELMRFQKGIAIAGTHGKTTTTSLVATILMAGGLDPTFVVGGLVNSANANAKLGRGEYLVAEADESDASFLNLQPDIVAVTNIDADHMTTYDNDFNKLTDTFVAFIKNIPFYGRAVLCWDDENVRKIRPLIHKPILTYGFHEAADIRGDNVRAQGGTMLFDVSIKSKRMIRDIELNMPGQHNVQNALAAIAIADHLEVDISDIKAALSGFSGVGRRFQRLGDLLISGKRVSLVDDYAHHPRELAATLKAAHGCWPDRRIIAVFQPHRYSRTHDLFDDFVVELADCEKLVICDVYPAGEEPISGADGRALCKAIRGRGKTDPVFVPVIEELASTLESIVADGDVVLTLGAGSIGKASNDLAGFYQQSESDASNFQGVGNA